MRNSLYCLAGLMLLVSCSGSSVHMVDSTGREIRELDYLWLEVDKLFEGGLSKPVTVVAVNGPNASFMIEENSIGVPKTLTGKERRGEICRELTCLALHGLSGGDQENRGRCFENHIVFLQQAIAGYVYALCSEGIPDTVKKSGALCARLFRENKISTIMIRDWETFYWRGLWSDQYQEWNQEGLFALISLGDFLERHYGLTLCAEIFVLLSEDLSLEDAVKKVLSIELNQLLDNWRQEVLSTYPEEKENSQ